MHLKSVTLQSEKYPTRDYYPFTLPVLHQTKRIVFDTPVTLFVGENGTGKSTLLEALALACGIHIWRAPEGARYEVNRYEGQLPRYLALEWSQGRVHGSFFGSDIFRHFAQSLDEWAASDPGQLQYFGGKSLVTQSHGQSLMSFFRSRYQIKGLYLLDEPETALSPRSQLELLEILGKMSQAGHAQFIVASHSPILLACANATIYSFDQIPVQPVAYEDTEHYQIYKSFLADRGKWGSGVGD
jgi:predicted ATPase